MNEKLDFRIKNQPTDTTCGPACLHAIYNYFGDTIDLDQVIDETYMLKEGGTLAVFLACHALRRGYSALIYTYNLNLFDPTWFNDVSINFEEKLRVQAKTKEDLLLHKATEGYLEFLSLGGRLRFKDLTYALIRKYVKHGIPILTGLSSTYLYRGPREYGYEGRPDDIKGYPAGHFVVLCGYDSNLRTIMVADPYFPNPYSKSHHYFISIERVLCSILLGIITYDANLLVIMPGKKRKAL